MDMVPLSASARSAGKNPRQLREDGQVPCVVYGNEAKNTSLQCVYKDIYNAYVKAGESTLVELTVDGTTIPTLFHEVTFEPVSGKITHADFYAVNMKKEIEADVPLHTEGESLAVKELGAILVMVMDHVTVKCLPAHLPHALTISIAGLKEFHDTLHVSDIPLPEGVRLLEEADAVVVTAQEPRAEEEIAPPAAEAVPAEGAAAPAAEGAAPAGEAAPATK